MHTIKFAAQYTGLSQHTIRAWERRYGALQPDRTPTNRRLYSAEDLEKLRLLRRAVEAGHSIGQIAHLSQDSLRNVLDLTGSETGPNDGSPPERGAIHPETQSASFLDECLHAVERLDTELLHRSLARATSLLGATTAIEHVIAPLLKRIGEDWRSGQIRPAHEHMATALVRTFLGKTLSAFRPEELAPFLIVTTPVGQIHELGALIVAVTAASEGWQVLYLGPNLPAEEIAGAVLRSRARAVALSIVYPPDDTRLADEILALRSYLKDDIPVLVGGQMATAYRATLDSIGAIYVEDLQKLRMQLSALRCR